MNRRLLLSVTAALLLTAGLPRPVAAQMDQRAGAL
jgi:hypothetical protein